MNKTFIQFLITYNIWIKLLIALFLWAYFYWIGSLTWDRIKLFFIIFFLILIYKLIFALLLHLFEFLNKNNYINKKRDTFLSILWYLAKIQKWKNPLIVMLGYIDNILYKLFKNINYLLIKNFKDKYKNADDSLYLQFILYVFCIRVNLFRNNKNLFIFYL